MRRLLGWEPQQTTVFEYDGAGRLIRSVTTTEAEFDDEQRALAIAHHLLAQDVGEYGESLSEAFSPDADPLNEDGKYRYKAGLRINFAAKAVEDAVAQSRKEHPEGSEHGHRWVVRKVSR